MQKSYYLFSLCFFIIGVLFGQNPKILGLDCSGGSSGKGQLFILDSSYNQVNTLQNLNYHNDQGLV